MSEDYILVYILYWFFCGIAASWIAEAKQATTAGLVIGLLLGPVGVLAAGFLDNRPKCSRCGSRVNGTRKKPFAICPYCHLEFTPSNGLFEERNAFTEQKESLDAQAEQLSYNKVKRRLASLVNEE